MSDLFPAFLKYWRGRRGLSQLDLALGADLSSRHVSFFETARAKPSREMVRPFVVDWESVAHALLARLHREALRALMEYRDVPESWRQPDLGQADEPVFTVRLERDELKLSFLTTLTMFSAPRNITLDELRIESYFPLDDETRQACRRLAG